MKWSTREDEVGAWVVEDEEAEDGGKRCAALLHCCSGLSVMLCVTRVCVWLTCWVVEVSGRGREQASVDGEEAHPRT